MDPQAALERYWAAVAARDWDEACDAYEAIRAWLERGGFEPDWEPRGRTAFFLTYAAVRLAMQG